MAYSTHYTCQGGDFIDDDKEDDQPAAGSMFDALQVGGVILIDWQHSPAACSFVCITMKVLVIVYLDCFLFW